MQRFKVNECAFKTRWTSSGCATSTGYLVYETVDKADNWTQLGSLSSLPRIPEHDDLIFELIDAADVQPLVAVVVEDEGA